jgi:hypothetical protein
MKKFVKVLLKSTFFVALTIYVSLTEAQITGKMPTSGDFQLSVWNIKQTDPNTLEFDIFILNTNNELKFELALFQAGIEFNTQILNGAAQTPGMTQILQGTSELADSLVPLVVNTATPGLIRLAGRPAPKKTGGTIISGKDQGTRVCRLRITNSVPFAINTAPGFRFTSNTSVKNSYATRVGVFFDKKINQLEVIPDKNAVVNESLLLNTGSEK